MGKYKFLHFLHPVVICHTVDIGLGSRIAGASEINPVSFAIGIDERVNAPRFNYRHHRLYNLCGNEIGEKNVGSGMQLCQVHSVEQDYRMPEVESAQERVG